MTKNNNSKSKNLFDNLDRDYSYLDDYERYIKIKF